MKAFVENLFSLIAASARLFAAGFRSLSRFGQIQIAMIGGVVAWIATFFDWVGGLIDTIGTKLTEMFVASGGGALIAQGSAWSDMLAFMNALYPLEETVLIIAGLTAIWIPASLVRIIKSWIPTES